MQVAVGTYIGTGGAFDVTCGFTPDLVIVKSTSTQAAVYRTKEMPWGKSLPVHNVGMQDDCIYQFIPTGFSIGSSTRVNTVGVVHHWLAVKATSARDFATGSYPGNGSGPRSITGLGFAPAAVFGKEGTSSYMYCILAGMPMGYSYALATTVSNTTNYTALLADGFSVDNSLNSVGGGTIYWFAFAAVPDFCSVGTFTGSGGDDRNLDVLSFQPDLLLIRSWQARVARWRTTTVTGDNTLYFGPTAQASNAIQAFRATGFQVGNSTDVNQIGVDNYYFALRAGTTAGDTGTAIDTADARQVNDGIDTGAASDTATLLQLRHWQMRQLRVNSSLDSFADAIQLTVAEVDPLHPLTPTMPLWRTLDSGSRITATVGLRGSDQDDLGTFRVDECSLVSDGDGWATQIQGRDLAALLIESRAERRFQYGVNPETDATQQSYPSAKGIAARLIQDAGLRLSWRVDDYHLPSFSLGSDETLVDGMRKLLEPLQQVSRHRVDAWIEDDVLVVQRRGEGPIMGTVDCRLGSVKTIRRTQQPAWGVITVTGQTTTSETVYRGLSELTQTTNPDSRDQSPQPTTVNVLEEDARHRVTETTITQANGLPKLATRETEEFTYQEVFDGDQWLGRVVIESMNQTEDHTTGSSSVPKLTKKVTSNGYDANWRLVLIDERVNEYGSSGKTKSTHTITRHEQVDPVTVRTTVSEFKIGADGTEKLSKGFPKFTLQTGVLQSAIQQIPDSDQDWQHKPDGTQPAEEKTVVTTTTAKAIGDGGGSVPCAVANDAWTAAMCAEVRDDLGAESGAFRYEVELSWARRWPYRKGHRISLTQLPGGCQDLDAVIVGQDVDYSVTSGWLYTIRLEAWSAT